MLTIPQVSEYPSAQEQLLANHRIACVIPAYNEERFIAGVIRGIPDFIDQIIVVNDASKDGTARVVEALNDPRVILVSHETNKGVGGAMITGYRRALALKCDVVVKLDGDGQMDQRNIKRLILPILRREADYTKGVRFRDSEVLKEMPLLRLVGNLGLSFLTKIASGYWNIFDPTNGFTALGREALQLLKLDRLSSDYFFETSMLINLYRIDAKVVDVPMRARYGAEVSKLSIRKVFLTFPGYLLHALVKRILWRYFIRDFTAFSAFFVAGSLMFTYGFVFGLYHWINNAMHHVATPTGTVMLATVPLILGFEFLLQAVVLDIHEVPQTPICQSSPDQD